MQVTIKYNDHINHPVKAAFIRSDDPYNWLSQLSQWKIDTDTVTCFILTTSKAGFNTAGLFVIFSTQVPDANQISFAYGEPTSKLYIPVNAELYPAIQPEELSSLLIWDYQVFHPTLGFFGFEKKDSISLTSLINISPNRPQDWTFAVTGIQNPPSLQRLRMIRPEANDLFEDIRKEINNKSLEDIPKPKSKAPEWLSKFTDPIVFGLLKTFLPVVGNLINTQGKPGSYSDKPGLLNKLQVWMEQNLKNLEEKRNNEIQRLLKLFDENSDEALQYAIPLSSPHLNRGTAAPSGSLSWRNTSFSLSGLRGHGGAVDSWDIGDYYSDLRKKYELSAQNALQKKDFRKAAYIYANLIGNFQSAANALEQGKYFHEAAVIYKDHLHDKQAAAACLEKGGLYSEAIPLYESLQQYEKCGDLYMLQQQQQQAFTYYEKSIEQADKTNNYLEVARIADEKLGNRLRAQETLINGWQVSRHPEPCLLKYFELKTDNTNDKLSGEIQYVYSNLTPETRKSNLLNILTTLTKKNTATAVVDTCREVAFEIVSQDALSSKRDSLLLLKHFFPHDKLINSDSLRFLHNYRKPSTISQQQSFQLVKDVAWKKVIVQQHQVLCIGSKNYGIYLARLNWEGWLEYHSWTVQSSPSSCFLTTANENNPEYLYLYNTQSILGDKTLPTSNQFNEKIKIHCPAWIPSETLGIGVVNNGNLVILHKKSHLAYLSLYNNVGEVLTSTCLFDNAAIQIPDITISAEWSNGYFYQPVENTFLIISEKGNVQGINVETIILSMDVYSEENMNTVALGTESGGILYYHNEGKGEILEIPCKPNYKMEQVKFIYPNYLVASCDTTISVFNLSNRKPILVSELETEKPITIFQGEKRNQFAVLDNNGLITLHNIEEEQ